MYFHESVIAAHYYAGASLKTSLFHISVLSADRCIFLFYFQRYYDGDQEKLFNEAHVVSPHRKELFVKKVCHICTVMLNTKKSLLIF